MKNKTKIVEFRKNAWKGLLTAITILVIIVIALILYLGFLINKDKIEYEISVNNRIDSIKDLFGTTSDFNKDSEGLTDIYKSQNGEEIEFFSRDENRFKYKNPNYKILLHELDGFTSLQYWDSNDESLYSLALIKQDLNGGNFLENPSNYKIRNVIFDNNYYEKYVELSGNLLIWPNGAYYSGDFNENKQPNGFGEMHYFGTDTANNLKINDKITLELDDSFSFQKGMQYYIGNFENGKYKGKGEFHSYDNGGYGVVIYKRNNYDGKPIGGYDIYRYKKINKNGGTYIESPESYELDIESHIYDDGTSETTEKDFYGITYKTRRDANRNESIEYNGVKLKDNPLGYNFYIKKINSLNPTISGNTLIYKELSEIEKDAEYVGDFYELSGNIIKNGKGVLSIDFGDKDYEYTLSGLRDNNNFIEGVENYTFGNYFFTQEGLFSGNTFSGYSIDTKFGIYTGTMNVNGGIFHESGSFKQKDGTYYSGGFSNMDEGGYEGYGEFRYYIPIKTGGNFIENEENYEMVYELTGYWREGEYIGKNWYKA